MAVDPININNSFNVAAAQDYRRSLSESSGKDNMSMQDFLMLVVAQMQNQDINNTMDNGQFMAQMAQIASMQAMQELTAAFMSSMSMSYMGKYVIAGATTDDGRRVREEGYVERVSFNGGEALVLVNDVWFKVQDVFEIMLSAPEIEPESDEPEEDSG
jgi:flagellar basal-body rod modification protein FlgD